MNVVLKSIDNADYAWALFAKQDGVPMVEIGVLESIIVGDECQYVYVRRQVKTALSLAARIQPG